MGFLVSAQKSINLCIRQKLPAVLIFFDLNKFKQIKDKYGHAEGDLTLIEFANQLKQILRDWDLLARFGGDEFVALLLNTSSSRKIK